jgi:hypothetical protein
VFVRQLSLSVCLLSLLSAASAAYQQTTPVPCGGQVYKGFDSRLTGELLTRIPEATKDFVGLEVDGKQVFIATATGVFMISDGKVARTRSSEPLDAIAVDGQGDLLMQSRRTIRILPRVSGKAFSVPGETIAGRIIGSGADSFLETRRDATGRTELIARRTSDFAGFQLLTLQGDVGPLAWTPAGLAAIVDGGIVTMDRKDAGVGAIDRDRGYTEATGISRLSDGRVVVSLKNLLMLTTGTTRLVLAAIHGATRAADSSLVVFDRETGYVWRVTGLEKVGDAAADKRHAEQLLSQWKQNRDTKAGLEAARILGCSALAQAAP